MKLKRLKLKNFAKFDDFELTFNKQITRLVGINGSGKTTVGLNAIWAGFKGIAEKGKDVLIGERFRFIGESAKTANIELLVVDDKIGTEIEIKRKITKDVNQISFKSTLEDSIDKDYIENLFNTVFLSAKHFCTLSGKQQAISLGIDTSEFDSELSDMKEDAKNIRRNLKGIGELPEVEKVEKVNMVELLSERDSMLKTNSNIAHEKEARKRLDLKFEDINKQIEALNKDRDIIWKEIEGRDDICEVFDLINIDDKIANAEQTNAMALQYNNYLEKVDNRDKVVHALEENISKQDTILANKEDHIKSVKFNVKGLSVNEDGELTLKNKLIRDPYFSKGELEMIVAQLAANQHPEFKVRFIDDFDSYDEGNQEKLIRNLIKAGFQIITAEVGDEIVKDNTVLLKECKVIERSVR